MWIGITEDDLLKILQNKKCKNLSNSYGNFSESLVFTFEDSTKIKITSDLYMNYSQILIEREFIDRGESKP
ncbi:MAG: hypothetical protein ACXAC2_00600 [Candidatus Kariarchaeaceae archaeon]|jgi:hypothetical protein